MENEAGTSKDTVRKVCVCSPTRVCVGVWVDGCILFMWAVKYVVATSGCKLLSAFFFFFLQTRRFAA